jgi:hypothetical protein
VTVDESKSQNRKRDAKQTNNVAELMMHYVDQVIGGSALKFLGSA